MKTSATVIITFTLLAVLLFVGNVSAEVLAESPHPYANNYDHTWSITDPTATQMRIHFQNITLANGDFIRLYDGHGGTAELFQNTDNGNDIWSEWFTTDTIEVRLVTDAGTTAWGFLVDQKEVRTGLTCSPTNPNALAESCHPYANNYDNTWTITDPTATQMRIHFQRISLDTGDTIGLYNGAGNLLATYHPTDNGLNIWSNWYPTNTIKVQLTTSWLGNDWGFLVDQMDSRPPASITNLHNTTYLPNSITWNWTDPSSSDYMYARVFLDGVWVADVPKGVQTYTATPLTDETQYTLSINTEGPVGIINTAMVTSIAWTSPLPPLSINSLGNTTYLKNSITWTWNDPSTPPGFDHVQIFLNGVEQTPVPATVGIFTATGLTPNTSYTIGTRTVGPSGVINQTWVNKTAWTALAPPASITNLTNTTYLQDSITWNWTDPTSSDFNRVRIFLNGVQQPAVLKGVQTYMATGLTPNTQYNISTRTIGNTGLVNATWVNHTAWTAPAPPFSITSLGNTSYERTYIRWTWNDPSTPPDFDHVQVFLNGVEQTPVAKGIGIFNATGLTPNTSYTIGTRTVGPSGVTNQTWVNKTAWTAHAPPGIITNLTNTTYLQDSITWTWTDPTSVDFDRVRIFINNVLQTPPTVAKGVQTFNATGLTPNTQYNISTKTIGTTGLVNPQWVNHTAWTAPAPPLSINSLGNTTYQPMYITWTWNDPVPTTGFDHVQVFLNGVEQTPVVKGIGIFNATGLTPNTSYTIGTRTVGPTGVINQTWVNKTAWTAPAPPVPPASITNLHNTTYEQTTITWNWTDPSSPGYTNARVFLNDAFQQDVAKGVQTYTKTGLTPSTAYTLKINTEGPIGYINATWVTNTSTTAPVPPACITNLTNTTYLPTSITWTWNDPGSTNFTNVKVYLDGVFKADVPKGNKTYTATGLTPLTTYLLSTRAEGPVGVINETCWVNNTSTTASAPPAPPASITNLHNTTYEQTTITWNWTDPSSPGYTNARVFLNDAFQQDVAKGVQTFTKTGLTPSTAYTLKINTEGPIGYINATWVTNTSTTAPVPPACITNLTNTTYLPTSITWTWNDPGSTNFTNVKVYLDGVFKADVPKGNKTYTATGLTPLTTYLLSTRAEGPVGVINETCWVNNTSTTASAPPAPPASITNLHNTTYEQTTITWNWTDPSSPGYTNARVFLNDAYQADVAKGVQTFTKNGLTPSTAYTLKINTEGPVGFINATWVTNTSTTAPVPPACITNLTNTTYLPTSITWTWNDPDSTNFTNVKVYLDGVFKADVPKGNKTYTATGLTPLTTYLLSTRAEGPVGVINETCWVNNTSTTASAPPAPPASITNLHNTTYEQTTITWNWTDPSSPGYTNARVFLNDAFQQDVAKGVQTFTKNGLTPSTAYTLKINTEGPVGFINATWVTNTSITAPVPPACITNLTNTTYLPTSITWTWNDPGSTNFTNVKVYLDGVFKADVPKGNKTYTATGLTPLTTYLLSTRAEGPVGVINETCWVNNTSTTASAPPAPPASITNLHNTTYEQTTITWNWTDPSSPGYTNARVFLNDAYQADVAKGVQTFTKNGLTPSTAYTLKINTEGPVGFINATWVTNTSTTAPVVPPVPVPPASVTNLHNTTYEQTTITWDWTNPSSAGFDYVRVYLDGVEQSPVLNGNHTYTATGLTPSTAYTLGIRTVGTNGQINATTVTNTSTTAPVVPPVPPASVTNLHNTTYLPTSITWNWTDPSSPGYTNARVFLDGVFQVDVPKGVQTFTKTGLTPSTAYTLSISTEGPVGIINTTWVTNTSTTAPSSPVAPPASITNLHNITYQPTTITWAWTDPSSAGYTNARVFLNGVFQADVLKGVQTFTKTGLTPSTAYTLSINTEGPVGVINATMVTNTSTTAPSSPVAPPASITNLHNTTYQPTTITWTWTDPSSAGYTNARVFLNGVFQADVLKGVQTFTKTGLTPSTAYTLSINTEGPVGVINATMVTNTAMTAPLVPPVPVPPASITNLHNTTYLNTSITWNWTDPSSADFSKVMVYLNGVFKGNVTKGTQAYTATGLNASTAYTIGTRTVGTTGLINATWVNSTATTASGAVTPVIVPVARFTANPWSGPVPVTVHFSVLTPGAAETYLWVFGDGTTSTEMNPVHTYSYPAYYRVTLTVSNAAGSSIARGYVFAGRSTR